MKKYKFIGILMAATLAAALAVAVGGCSQGYHSDSDAAAISVHADHQSVKVGETVWLHASTLNMPNANIQWKVTPSNALISPDSSRQNQFAKFSADQPGGYVVKAFAKLDDGQWVTDRTSISVVGNGNE